MDRSLDSLPSRQLLRMLKLFPQLTREWYDVHIVLSYRKWVVLYGEDSAMEMRLTVERLWEEAASSEEVDREVLEQLNLLP